MRSTWWLVLLATVIAAGNVQLAVGGKSSTPKPRIETRRSPERTPDVVDGYGETKKRARENALEHAQERVERLLEERFGKSGWRLKEDQLDPEVLRKAGVIHETGEAEQMPDEKMFVARYRVALTDEYVKDVQRAARQDRVQDRHLVLARVLGALLALCLVVAGYLRLEEWTRGYASRLLGVAALVLLALAGAGLWLTL